MPAEPAHAEPVAEMPVAPADTAKPAETAPVPGASSRPADHPDLEETGALWQFVLHGIILPFRPRRKGRDYDKIRNRERPPRPCATRRSAP